MVVLLHVASQKGLVFYVVLLRVASQKGLYNPLWDATFYDNNSPQAIQGMSNTTRSIIEHTRDYECIVEVVLQEGAANLFSLFP
mgnify:CR=1 FL=1